MIFLYVFFFAQLRVCKQTLYKIQIRICGLNTVGVNGSEKNNIGYKLNIIFFIHHKTTPLFINTIKRIITFICIDKRMQFFIGLLAYARLEYLILALAANTNVFFSVFSEIIVYS